MKLVRTPHPLWTCLVGVCVFLLSGFDGSVMTAQAVFAAEDLVKDAATVEEVAKVIDLRTLPLPEGAVVSDNRQLGTLTYETSADLKKSFEFQQKQLTKLGWKELPGSRTEPTYCTGTFQKSNFVVTLMSYDGSMPDKPKMSRVFITNVGNVRLNKMPALKGAKSLYSTEAAAGYVTDLKTDEAATATRKLLLEAGWEPFGSHKNPPDAEVLTFKRNAIQLMAYVAIAPAQQGKVVVSYNVSVLSVDLPTPPNADEVEFDNTKKTLIFRSSDKEEDVAKFYQQRLAKLGWKPVTDEDVKEQDKALRPTATQQFRNAAKDVVWLHMFRGERTTRVVLRHLTAAEAVAAEKSEKEAAEKLVAETKAREEAAAARKMAKKTAPKSDDDFPDIEGAVKAAIAKALKDSGSSVDKALKGAKANAGNKEVVSIPIPDETKKVNQTSDNVLQLKLPPGKGQAAAEFLRNQLVASEWEEGDDDKLTAKSGHLSFTKGRQKLTMTFMDIGRNDVNLMIIGFGANLEPGKADPNVKVADAESKPKSKPKSEPGAELKPSKKTAKKPKSESDGDSKPVVEPERIAKPVRGITKLAKLPNEANVTINDKATVLKHVLAYEAIQQGRWVTRIVATDKPIKQSSLLTLLLKTGHDEGFNLPQPHVRVELDDHDKPNSMSLRANDTPGGVGSSDMKGEAIVEDGRARGSFKLAKPGEFFDKTYDGEISFDVPVLTRHSQPAKQLADAPKLENSGKLLVNDKPIKLPHVVAYEVKVFDEKRTAIFFTEKPINLEKLKASLRKDGTDSGLFEVTSQVKVEIDKDDRPAMMHLWCDNASLNSNSDLVGDVVIEEGRARGTVKLNKPSEFFGKLFSFEIKFDVDVLLLPATTE